MKNKDEIYKLFQEGCPSTMDGEHFREKTLDQIRTDAMVNRGRHHWKGVASFMMSPLPLILSEGILAIIYRDRVFEFIGGKLDVSLIAGAAASIALVILSCISVLIDDSKEIDMTQLRKDVGNIV